MKYLFLFCLFLFGSRTAFAGGAENQMSCSFLEVYKEEIDKCVSILRKEEQPSEPDIQEISQNIPRDLGRDIKVISIITIKKGDNCIKVTKLSLQECLQLGRDYGRTPTVFIDAQGKRTFDIPLNIGEQIAFVRYSKDGDIRFRYIISTKK